ncbi:hypothetical protein, partial [Pseudomonas syringae group genomosp. 7]|uniref:hypothetical protein n=1 Tax=Pseudomonas syringae group genomosp. 7 TaxID=251699 RepID=UPI0037700DF5
MQRLVGSADQRKSAVVVVQMQQMRVGVEDVVAVHGGVARLGGIGLGGVGESGGELGVEARGVRGGCGGV